MKKLIAVFVVIVCSACVFVAWESFRFLNTAASDEGTPVFFEVRPGESVKTVASRLESSDLISNARKFYLLARFIKKTNVRVGEYQLRANMYPKEILDILKDGKSVQRPFTVQEGLNKFEIANAFESRGFGKASDFLALVDNPKFAKELLGEDVASLEGYLFPETYNLTKFTGAKGLIKRMVSMFLQVWSELEKEAGEIEMPRKDVVILASIVEKETGAPEERKIVSSVYHNRLKKPMRLYADPTVLYGIWVQTKSMKHDLTKKDLRTKTPYNTYTNGGLPVGPIANPGRLALEATLKPAETGFYYFVSKNDGTHVFTTDYKSHLRAVKQYQLNKKAREGKSWRDLNKRKVQADTTAVTTN